MPAINPSRLQNQIDKILVYFDQPQAFHRHLVDLFSLYANRSLHFGQLTEPGSTAPMYHLPQPLILQLHGATRPYIKQFPQAALKCADALWNDPYIEVKQFAIYILGNVTLQEPDPIINLLGSWIEPDLENSLKSDLISKGTKKLQKDFPTAWEKLIKSLLDQKDPGLIEFGILGLQEGVQRKKSVNFPMVFRVISPIIQNPSTPNMEKLEDLIRTLIKQSPIETAFFLKQTLSLSQSTNTKRLIKRCLPMLPENEQLDLKISLE